jgi:hypothetical protein
LADAGENGEARGEWYAIGQRSAALDALVGMFEGGIQLVLLAQDFGQANVRDARRWR